MRAIFVVCIFFAGCSPTYFVKKEIAKAEGQLHDHVGFALYALKKNKMVADVHAATYFTPASNIKIFTLYTSLKLLDSIASLKYIRRGDSLIFWGMGDPSFLYPSVFDNRRTYDFLNTQASQLFFSPTNFAAKRLGAGWAWDDYNSAYSAECFSFPMYGNLISIKRAMTKFVFQPARFAFDFQPTEEIHRHEEIVRNFDSNHVTYFKGKYKSHWTIPFHCSADLCVDLLSDTLHRKVTLLYQAIPENVMTLKSSCADSLYKVMMQASDNFIAEQLLLQCAAVLSDTLKSQIAIRYAMKNFFADLPDTIQWADGSGLSRYNLVTPRSIVAVWKKISDIVPQARLFRLLAVGGKSGTLKNGYKGKPFIFGKSGTLSNNYNLSGFLLTKKGNVFIFSFMHNNFVGTGNDVQLQMEKVLTYIRDKF